MTASDITVVITHVGRPRREMLVRALMSVQAQTLEPDSIVISIDTEREGAARTRQRGLDQVQTEYVAWLDDDDEFKPQHLQRLKETMIERDADLVYPWYDVVGGLDPLPLEGREFDPVSPGLFPVTYMVRTECAREAGGWAPEGYAPLETRSNEDWLFELRLIEHGTRIVHLNERTWKWMHWGGNASGLSAHIPWDRS